MSDTATVEAEIEITGMHCGSCVALVEETLAEDPAVVGAQVDLEAGRARVRFDPKLSSVEALCATVTELGYPAAPAAADPAAPAAPSGTG